MAATLAPPAPSTAPPRQSRARRALALVVDALALAGTTLARDAPARPPARRHSRFARTL